MSLLQEVHTEHINRGTLSGTRHTCDADTHRLACEGKAFLDDLLRYLLMLMLGALHQRDGLTEHGDVPFQDALHIFSGGITLALHTLLHVGIHRWDIGDTLVHFQSFIQIVILWMFHTDRLFIGSDLDQTNRSVRVVAHNVYEGF